MAEKKKVIVILLVFALIFSLISITLHFVSSSQKMVTPSGTSGQLGQVKLVIVPSNASAQSRYTAGNK